MRGHVGREQRDEQVLRLAISGERNLFRRRQPFGRCHRYLHHQGRAVRCLRQSLHGAADDHRSCHNRHHGQHRQHRLSRRSAEVSAGSRLVPGRTRNILLPRQDQFSGGLQLLWQSPAAGLDRDDHLPGRPCPWPEACQFTCDAANGCTGGFDFVSPAAGTYFIKALAYPAGATVNGLRYSLTVTETPSQACIQYDKTTYPQQWNALTRGGVGCCDPSDPGCRFQW